MPSSNSLLSAGSDTEFWVTLDTKPTFSEYRETLPGDSTLAISTYSPTGLDDTHSFDVNVELMKRASKQPSPQSRGRSPLTEAQLQKQFERSLEMIRKAKNIEVVNSSILMKHSLTKEFEMKLLALKKTFKQQKDIYQRDVEFLKVELMKKSTEALRFQQMVEEQEILITQLRILSRHSTPAFSRHDSSTPGTYRPTSESPVNATSEFLAEIELAKMQIDSLKVVIDQYKTESEERGKTCKELNDQIGRIRLQYEMEKSRIEGEMETLRDECRREREYHEQEFRAFKGEANTESLMHEEIQKRLQAAITTLQEELRTAKLVLTHPRLRNKVFTRIKDVENAVIELERTTITPSPSTPGSKSTRISKHSFFSANQPQVKMWNPKDHRNYLQTNDPEKMSLERSMSTHRERASSSHPSMSGIEGRRLPL